MKVKLLVKRLIDISFSLAAFVILFPVFAITSLLVLIKLGSPIFFKQERVGMGGKVFTIYKFRTMLNLVDKDGCLLSDEDRLTTFGKFIRSTSLDELPELFNVFIGDISLVGPRPLLVDYLPLYNERQRKRHNVLPGITGWAQVNGRNNITWEDKFELDVWYVENWSLLLDIKIMIMTIPRVFKREGINQVGCATSQRFRAPTS